nr:protein lin-52 homolog isoform X2 [Microcebus murinus]
MWRNSWGTDLEASLLSFEKLDRASPDLWPEQLPGVAEFAASFKSPITSSPPKWMAEIERDDIDMLKELGSLTTANLMEKPYCWASDLLPALPTTQGCWSRGKQACKGSVLLVVGFQLFQRDDTGEIPQHSREAQEVAAVCGQDVLGTVTKLPSQCSSDDAQLTASSGEAKGVPPGLPRSPRPGTLHL